MLVTPEAGATASASGMTSGEAKSGCVASRTGGPGQVTLDDLHMAPSEAGRTCSGNMAWDMRERGAQLHHMAQPGVEEMVEAERPRVRANSGGAASNWVPAQDNTDQGQGALATQPETTQPGTKQPGTKQKGMATRQTAAKLNDKERAQKNFQRNTRPPG